MLWLTSEPSALKVSVLLRPQEAVAALAVLRVEEHTQTHQHVPQVVVLLPQELSWWVVGLDDAFFCELKLICHVMHI